MGLDRLKQMLLGKGQSNRRSRPREPPKTISDPPKKVGTSLCAECRLIDFESVFSYGLANSRDGILFARLGRRLDAEQTNCELCLLLKSVRVPFEGSCDGRDYH